MRCVQVLSTLALKRLLRCAAVPVGQNGTSRTALQQLMPASQHMARALRQANARAWVAMEVLLAGDELWERAQLTWERSLDAEFFRPLRAFLDQSFFGLLDDQGADGRRNTATALRAALAIVLLTSGPLDL